jgi:hypothetical protein
LPQMLPPITPYVLTRASLQGKVTSLFR